MTEVAVAFAFPRERRQAKLAAPKSYRARVARQLALAHALQRRVDRGEFVDHADLARELGFTRARISQLMNLLLLAPDIQEEILFLETPPGTPGPPRADCPLPGLRRAFAHSARSSALSGRDSSATNS